MIANFHGAWKRIRPAVAKLETRPDMYVRNFRRYIEALGGTLNISARVPDGVVVVKGLGK